MRVKSSVSIKYLLVGLLLFIGVGFLTSKARLYFDMQRFTTAVRDNSGLIHHDVDQKKTYLKHHYLNHAYNAISWQASLGTVDIPTIELKVPQNILDQWRKSKQKPLPDWKNALARTWDSSYQPVRIRVRGDYSYHWGTASPSLKIKLPKTQTFLGYRKFNLINPRSATGFERVVGAQLAKTMGLLSEDIAFVRVFVNGENWGPFQYVGALEEAWLRKHKQFPGDVFSGEVEPLLNIQTDQAAHSEIDIWDSEQYWEKVSYNNAIEAKNFSKLNSARKALKNYFANPNSENREHIEQHFDINSLLKLMALENWIGSRHTDRLHNWKVFHDPSSGKLQFVSWDMWGHEHGGDVNDLDLFWPLALPQLNVVVSPDLYLKKTSICMP